VPFDNTALPVSSAKPGGSEVSAVIVYGGVPPLGDRLIEVVPPCWNVPSVGPLLNVTTVPVEPIVRVGVEVIACPASSTTVTGGKKNPHKGRKKVSNEQHIRADLRRER
jgi:hypothetical protein